MKETKRFWKNKWCEKIIALVLVITTFLMPTLPFYSSVLAAEPVQENPVVQEENLAAPAGMDSTNWMGYLPNQVNLAMVNLPGTHDSGTAVIMKLGIVDVLMLLAEVVVIVTPFLPLAPLIVPVIDLLLLDVTVTSRGNISLAGVAKDQDLSIPAQFNAGVRLVDCRLSNYKGNTGNPDDLEFSHGGIRCMDPDNGNGYLKMKNVLQYAKDFVKAHPTETIVLGITSEGFAGDVSGLGPIKNLIEEKFASKDISNIDKNAEAAIQSLLTLKKNDPEFIVVEDKHFPTVGEARGKVILCHKDENTAANDVKTDTGEYNVDNYDDNGEDKWNTLKAYFDDADYQQYDEPFDELYTDPLDEKTAKQHIAESSCTGGDGEYMKHSIHALLKTLDLAELTKVFGLDSDEDVSGGNAQARIVKPQLKSYSFTKGKYYGWLYMDFIDAAMAKKYYSTNMFDFDIAGKSLEYISEMAIAFEQDYQIAKKNLEIKGYTVLPLNFNEEGMDKILSHAIVNGVENPGTFNLAIGYKTSRDPHDALTGITWTAREYEATPLEKEVSDFIENGHYQLVELAGTTIEAEGITLPVGYSSLNIGTVGDVVNLYVTKDQTCGERIIALDSVQGYEKTFYDPITHQMYSPKEMMKSLAEIGDKFQNGWDMPRDPVLRKYLDIEGEPGETLAHCVLSSNFCRGDVNDVYLFYNAAFNDADQPHHYLKLYKGEGPYGELNLRMASDSMKRRSVNRDAQTAQQGEPTAQQGEQAINTGITGNDSAVLSLMLGLIALAVAGLMIVLIRRRR